MRQRREILGKQIAGARRPQSFGSSSGAAPSPQPSESARGQSPGSSPAASLSGSARRALFDSGAAAVLPQAQPGSGGLAVGRLEAESRSDANGSGPQRASRDRPVLGNGRWAESVPWASGVGLNTAVAKGTMTPQGTALTAPAAAKSRRRPWLSQE